MKISILQTPGGGLCVIHYTVTIQLFCQPQIFVRQQWNIGYQDPEFLRIAHRHFQRWTVTASSFASSAMTWGLPRKQKSEAPAWAKLTMSVINKRLILCSVGHSGPQWLTQALAGLWALWKALKQCRWATEFNSNSITEMYFTFCMKWLQSTFTHPCYR